MKTSQILLLLPISVILASCANTSSSSFDNNGERTPRQRNLFLNPLGRNSEIIVDQHGKNGGSTHQTHTSTGYISGDTYRNQGLDQAPPIKSQVYAQVPNQILQFPEIHNQDRYTRSAQEVEFRLEPLKNVPTNGFYQDPSKAYTADTYVAGGTGDIQPGHKQVDNTPARKYMRIRSGTGEITGMGRILGVTSVSQKKQAVAQIQAENGEQAHFVNGMGWIALIPQNN